MDAYRYGAIAFAAVLWFFVISSMLYIFLKIRKNKQKSFAYMGEKEDKETDQIFVEHKGESIPILRRELPMWEKLGISERGDMVKSFKNAIKKGKITKVDGQFVKRVKKSYYSF